MSQPRNPRDAILALGQTEREPLEGVDGAFIHRLSVADWDAYSKATENASLVLFERAVRDADGNSLFTADDHPALLAMDARTFGGMVRQVMRYNGLLPTSQADAEKN